MFNDSFIERLSDEILADLNIWPLCDCQTQATYCIVLRNECVRILIWV